MKNNWLTAQAMQRKNSCVDNQAADLRQVSVIRLYDELREKRWHGDDEN
jgi:hypothetical protein